MARGQARWNTQDGRNHTGPGHVGPNVRATTARIECPKTRAETATDSSLNETRTRGRLLFDVVGPGVYSRKERIHGWQDHTRSHSVTF